MISFHITYDIRINLYNIAKPLFLSLHKINIQTRKIFDKTLPIRNNEMLSEIEYTWR